MRKDNSSALVSFEDQFTEDEAQEMADVARDAAQQAAVEGKPPMEISWTVEAAVMAAFGYVEGDEDEEDQDDE